MTNIVIPMAGEGKRFTEAGYDKPKPLIDVFGKPMIQRVIENLSAPNNHFYLICRKEHNIPNFPNATIIEIDEPTEGAVCTVLIAKSYINNDDPLVIANCDQYIENLNIEQFVSNSEMVDAHVVTFNSTNPHHSYVQLKNGFVTKAAEKEVISDHAVAGIYGFRTGALFVEMANKLIERNIRYNNEFYISPIFNLFIEQNYPVTIHEISPYDKHMLGTPLELQIFENKVKNGEICLI